MRRVMPAMLLILAVLAAVWWTVATRRAAAWIDGDRATWLALADGVSEYVLDRAGDAGVDTGSARFNGEWDLGTCQMAVLGLGQVVLEFPDTKARYLPAMDRCLDWLVTEQALQFGTVAWGDNGLGNLGPEPRHAYLGYINMALGMRRAVDPKTPHAGLHDRLSEALASRLEAPVHRFQTYPHETYPPDLATVAGSVALHDRALGRARRPVLDDWLARFRAEAVDPDTGWVYQSLNAAAGGPGDGPRGSGSAFTTYFLAQADPELSASVYAAHRDAGHQRFFGFGAMREYPPGVAGWGDIDSGPVILGAGVSSTGFALAGASIHGDRDTHRRMYRTAHLFGLPWRGRWFATGGGIGNAIMLAMLTAGGGDTPAHHSAKE